MKRVIYYHIFSTQSNLQYWLYFNIFASLTILHLQLHSINQHLNARLQTHFKRIT